MTKQELERRDADFMNVKLKNFKTSSQRNASPHFCQVKSSLDPNDCYNCTMTEHGSATNETDHCLTTVSSFCE